MHYWWQISGPGCVCCSSSSSFAWGRPVSMHTVQPSPAAEQTPSCEGEPEELCAPRNFPLRVPERGEKGRAKESRGGRQGREGSLLHTLLKALRSAQTAGAARWLVCSLRGNVHWLYSLNCWRTAMTSDCCFYMFFLIGTKGKCTWLLFFFLVLYIANQIANKLQKWFFYFSKLWHLSFILQFFVENILWNRGVVQSLKVTSYM